MTCADVSSRGSDSYVAAYEKLRRHALSGSNSGGHRGLALFLRGGIATWLSCALVDDAVASARAAEPRLQARATLVSDELVTPIVQVLASMVLCGHRTEVHT